MWRCLLIDDKPRELLTIMWNHSRNYGRVQTLDELVRRLGWSRNQILDALQLLADREFFIWDRDRHNETKIIKSSDLDFIPAKPKLSHWMEYTQ